MASPVWGNPPQVKQEGLFLRITDRGDWQEVGGGKVDRFCAILYVEGDGYQLQAPPLSEPTDRAKLRPFYWEGDGAPPLIPLATTDIGKRVGVAVFGGTHYMGNRGEVDLVEWGRQDQRNEREPALSNLVSLTAGGTPHPEPTDAISDLITLIDSARLEWRQSGARLRVVMDNPNTYPKTHAGKMESLLDSAAMLAHRIRGH